MQFESGGSLSTVASQAAGSWFEPWLNFRVVLCPCGSLQPSQLAVGVDLSANVCHSHWLTLRLTADLLTVGPYPAGTGSSSCDHELDKQEKWMH